MTQKQEIAILIHVKTVLQLSSFLYQNQCFILSDFSNYFYLKNVNECRTVLVKNQIKKNFMEKEKKVIKILTVFFIFHKNDVKTFLK